MAKKTASDKEKNELSNKDDSLILISNEKLLASRAYILSTVDNVKGHHTFSFNLSGLNDLEVHGFLKLVQEQISDVWTDLEQSREVQVQDEDEDEDE